MTDAELDALEAAAKAATPGPWKIDPVLNILSENNPPIYVYTDEDDSIGKAADIKYVAAANPAVVLDLIAELRQARAERDWLVENMPNNVCPEGKTECADRCPTAGGKACYSCVLCWLEATKEATCQK